MESFQRESVRKYILSFNVHEEFGRAHYSSNHTLAVRTYLQSDLSWLNVPQAKQTIKQERALASCNSAR
ncbi:hypothetical protein NC653_026265 [Populus alba x Populus x berolinensis]|uniref:Uncharacterized protein n=1 Tax=Populus alba x Populus x berolinensis TaxID=444605 RepID=A0AAD6Q8Z7_9ROSI|nr:hypothetical protein NC653_026265 [Populus alba x Populus x berolinensis]